MRKPEDYKYHAKRKMDYSNIRIMPDGLTSEIMIHCRICDAKIIAYRLSRSHVHITVECNRCHQMFEGKDLHVY